MQPDHYCGVYRGIVTAHNASGYVRLRIPSLFGNQTTDWVPCSGSTPTTGLAVWVSFEAGNPDFPVCLGQFSTMID